MFIFYNLIKNHFTVIIKTIRIVALTQAGCRLGERLREQLPGSELWFKPKPFGETIQAAFMAGEP